MTEKEKVLALREGYVKGCSSFVSGQSISDPNGSQRAACTDVAKRIYPMPITTQPRVYTSSQGTKYRISDGKVQNQSRYRRDSGEWNDSAWSVEDFKQFGLLWSNPTEEVDCDC